MIRFLKGVFLENLFIKFLALVLAVFTFLYVHREDTEGKTIPNVPVYISGYPSEWRIIDVDHRNVDLVILGPRQKIEVRNNRNVQIALSLNNVDFQKKTGEFTEVVEISKDVVKGLDYDIDLLFVEDSVKNLKIKLAPYVKKQLSVELRTTGKPAPGYIEERKIVSPNIVDVTGPADIIRFVDIIPTEPIDVTGRKENIDLNVGLDVNYLKEEKNVVFECDSRVYVSIVIKPKPSEKKITGIPVRILNLQDKPWVIKTEPATVDVTVTGDVEELNKIHKSVIKAYIDADDLPGSPGKDINIGVKFFFLGEWDSLRIKDAISVKVDMAIKK